MVVSRLGTEGAFPNVGGLATSQYGENGVQLFHVNLYEPRLLCPAGFNLGTPPEKRLPS